MNLWKLIDFNSLFPVLHCAVKMRPNLPLKCKKTYSFFGVKNLFCALTIYVWRDDFEWKLFWMTRFAALFERSMEISILYQSTWFQWAKIKTFTPPKFSQKNDIQVEREQTEQPSVGLKQISIKMRQLGTANDPFLHFIGPLFQAQLDIDQKSKVVRKGKRGGGKKFHTTCLWFREHHSSRKYAHVFHPQR